jgi:hypothetical protein
MSSGCFHPKSLLRFRRDAEDTQFHFRVKTFLEVFHLCFPFRGQKTSVPNFHCHTRQLSYFELSGATLFTPRRLSKRFFVLVFFFSFATAVAFERTQPLYPSSLRRQNFFRDPRDMPVFTAHFVDRTRCSIQKRSRCVPGPTGYSGEPFSVSPSLSPRQNLARRRRFRHSWRSRTPVASETCIDGPKTP